MYYFEPTIQQARHEAYKKSSVDAFNILASERVAYYTKVLAAFTGVLSAFGVIQLFYLVRADSRAADADERAAQADDRAVRAEDRATQAADVVERQLALMDAQNKISADQQELSRTAHLLHHRGRVSIRNLGFYENRAQADLAYILFNHGDTDAEVIELRISVSGSISPVIFDNIEFEDVEKRIPYKIKPGGVLVVKLRGNDVWQSSFGRLLSERKIEELGRTSLLLNVIVFYKDLADVTRRTSAIRRLDERGMLVKAPDDEMDFED